MTAFDGFLADFSPTGCANGYAASMLLTLTWLEAMAKLYGCCLSATVNITTFLSRLITGLLEKNFRLTIAALEKETCAVSSH